MTTTPTPTNKIKYKTTNWKSYNESLIKRGDLTIWFDKDLKWEATASGKQGRQQQYSDAAIQFCLQIKCLFNLPLRQTMGFIGGLMKLAGVNQVLPNFSTISRRQESLVVGIRRSIGSAEGMHILVDSTGMKFLGEGEWKCKKHGAEYRRQWRKVHIAIDANTLEIQAIEMTDNSIGDATVLPDLLKQIPAEQVLLSVACDGAYDTKKCHEAIANRGAVPLIPPRKNAKLWKNPKNQGEINRNEAVRSSQYLGSALWKILSGYHKRSLVETKMFCFKRLGERVMARTFNRQNTEIMIRASLLNIFTKLGTPVTTHA